MTPAEASEHRLAEKEHCGSLLRRAREGRDLTLAELAAATKIPRGTLERLEAGRLEDLPGEVFVRGFIRSYAKAVGISEVAPIGLYERALRFSRAECESAAERDLAAAERTAAEDDGIERRGLGLAVFVIILLLIATITLSLLLRHPPQSGEGLSLDGRRPRIERIEPDRAPSSSWGDSSWA